MDALNDGFKMDQDWNNDAVLELLKQFLWDRQDKWQHNLMLLDIESYFKTVVLLENQDE